MRPKNVLSALLSINQWQRLARTPHGPGRERDTVFPCPGTFATGADALTAPLTGEDGIASQAMARLGDVCMRKIG